MHSVDGAMRNDEEDPKKPRPLSIGRKGDNTCESEEHGAREVDPDGNSYDPRDHHMHVRC